MTSTGFTPSASIDEAGVIYYVVVADGASAPTAAEVKAGTASGGGSALAAASATVSSSPFTSSFSAITSLSASTAYDVYFVAEDDEGTPNLQSSVTKVDATTSAPPDTTAPTFTFNPANAATGVAVNSNITITASEAIRLVAGNATLDDTNVDALITLKDTDASGTNIAFDATIVGNVITIDPTADFSALQQVYVAIDGTAVEDTADNAGALTSATFTTADISAPTLASSNPADDATGVAVGSNIVLTFSENIQAGTGNIVISDGVGDTRTIPVGDAQITIAGTTLTINPTADLNSSTSYYVQVAATAVDDLAGNSYAGITDTTTLNFTTAAPPAPPPPTNTAPIAHAGPDQTMASAASVTLDGTGSTDADGDTLTYAWTQTSGTTVTLSSPTAAQPTFNAPTLKVGDADLTLVFSLVVNDGTVNSAADMVSITIQAPLPTPATEFAENTSVIRQILVEEADRSLRSAVSANQVMTRGARQRFVAGARDDMLVTRETIPFDVDGVFRLSGATLSTNGTFFGQQGSADGAWRQLFFGDFNVQRDGDTGSNTATLTARVAWERMTSDVAMLGYFIGAELAKSDLEGSFTGDQNRVALTWGGYAVHQLAEKVYLDGFLTLGAGRNDLNMANAVLALESDYTTRTATLGAAVSGIYEYETYEFHPELSFSYGHTWIGNVGFTGRAYGLVDNTLSLDAGNISVANLILRPEVIWGLDAASVADSHSQLSFAPRMICEQTRSTRKTEACGGGAELGLGTQSDDGLTNAEFRVLMDRVGSSERTSYAINFEHRF